MQTSPLEQPENFINVETVDLGTRGVTFPGDRVGMVIAQPYISLTDIEPFQATSDSKIRQLQMITRTLEAAIASGHGAPKTHFTLFPEYSIPGMDGIGLLETVLRSERWPVGTVVIGGTDALTKDEFGQLANEVGTFVDTVHNGKDRIKDADWINCGITWIKAANGNLERWLQPKLHPAWPEMNISYQSMFRGHSIYVFKGFLTTNVPFRFATLVCFDWIATLDAQKSYKWILDHMQQQAAGLQVPLSWLFIIQHNQRPSHNTFLREVEAFFDQTQFPNALRDRACLVFANNAGIIKPGRTQQFGGCSLVLSQQSGFTKPKCALTVSNGGPRFRDGSDLLLSYKDVFFRERGACIHSFAQINPGSITAGAAGRVLAVENACVYPFDGVSDPRAPSAGVAAGVKWLNDELDELPSLTANYATVPFAALVDSTHAQNVAALRAIPAQIISHTVKLAAQESNAENEDEWDQTERKAVEHLVNTLNIVTLGLPVPTLGVHNAHATLTIGNNTFDVVAIRGKSHEACIDHSRRFTHPPRRRSLLVSRDPDNNKWLPKFGNFLDAGGQAPGTETQFTDPNGGSLHLGYRQLLDIFQVATTAVAVQEAINAELAA